MRLGPTLLVAVLLLRAVSAAAELPAAGCVRMLREARIAAEQGNPARELELLRRAAKDYPKEILPALALVEYPDRAQLEAGELQNARALVLDRLADPNAVIPNSALKRIAEDPSASQSDRAALKRGLEARLSRTPSDPELLEALGLVLARLPDREAERAVLARLDAVRPSAAIGWRRARLAEELGRREEALEIYRGIRSRYGDSPALAEKIGLSLVALGRFDEARQEAATLGAGSAGKEAAARLSLALAWALWDAGRDLDAQAAFREAARANPDDDEAADALRLLYATPDERKAAVAADAERFARVTDPHVLFEAGTTRLLAGDASAAAGLLRRAVAAAPDHEMAWFNLGVAAFHLERWDEARKAFESASALNSGRAESFLYLGEALLKLDRCGEAVAALKRALSLRSDLPGAHASLSDCYRRMGRTEDAEAELKLAKPPR